VENSVDPEDNKEILRTTLCIAEKSLTPGCAGVLVVLSQPKAPSKAPSNGREMEGSVGQVMHMAGPIRSNAGP